MHSLTVPHGLWLTFYFLGEKQKTETSFSDLSRGMKEDTCHVLTSALMKMDKAMVKSLANAMVVLHVVHMI